MSSGEAPTIIRGKCTLQPHVPGDGGVLSKAQILMEKLIRRDGPHPSIKLLTESPDNSIESCQKPERPSRLEKVNGCQPGCQQRRRSSGGDVRMQALCQRMQEERLNQGTPDGDGVSPARTGCPFPFPKPRIAVGSRQSPSPCGSPALRSPRYLTSPDWERLPLSPDSARGAGRQVSSSPTGLSSQTVSDSADAMEEPTSSRGVLSPRSAGSPPHTPTGGGHQRAHSQGRPMPPGRPAFPINTGSQRKLSMPNAMEIPPAPGLGLNDFPAYNGPVVRSAPAARGDQGRPISAPKSPPPPVAPPPPPEKLRTWTHNTPASPGRRTQSANPAGRRPGAAAVGTVVRAPVVVVPAYLPASPPPQAAAKAMSLPKHTGPSAMPMRTGAAVPVRRNIFGALGQKVPEPTAVISPTLTQYAAALNGSAPAFV